LSHSEVRYSLVSARGTQICMSPSPNPINPRRCLGSSRKTYSTEVLQDSCFDPNSWFSSMSLTRLLGSLRGRLLSTMSMRALRRTWSTSVVQTSAVYYRAIETLALPMSPNQEVFCQQVRDVGYAEQAEEKRSHSKFRGEWHDEACNRG